jgi:hypothetical protein
MPVPDVRYVNFQIELRELPGTARGRLVTADDGRDYVVKGPRLAPEQPYVAANELLCGLLADALGLPILSFAVMDWAGDLLFARPWVPTPPWRLRISTGHVRQAVNRSDVYGLALFDAWVLNGDRHTASFALKTTNGAGPRIMLFDHSQCPVAPGSQASDLLAHVADPISRYVQLDLLRDAITNTRLLTGAIANFVDITDDRIGELVRAVPTQMLPHASDRDSLIEFLAARRDRLEQLVVAEQSIFALDRPL